MVSCDWWHVSFLIMRQTKTYHVMCLFWSCFTLQCFTLWIIVRQHRSKRKRCGMNRRVFQQNNWFWPYMLYARYRPEQMNNIWIWCCSSFRRMCPYPHLSTHNEVKQIGYDWGNHTKSNGYESYVTEIPCRHWILVVNHCFVYFAFLALVRSEWSYSNMCVQPVFDQTVFWCLLSSYFKFQSVETSACFDAISSKTQKMYRNFTFLVFMFLCENQLLFTT